MTTIKARIKSDGTLHERDLKKIGRALGDEIIAKAKLITAMHQLIAEELEHRINFDDDNADHRDAKGRTPSNSIIKYKEFIPKIEEWTKLRRRVYTKIGHSSLPARIAMKEQAIAETDITLVANHKTYKANLDGMIVNNSPLMQYLMGGMDSTYRKKTLEQITKEYWWFIREVFGVEKGQSLEAYQDHPLYNDSDVNEYFRGLALSVEQNNPSYAMMGKGTGIGRVPRRNLVRSAAESIGKQFIKDNML